MSTTATPATTALTALFRDWAEGGAASGSPLLLCATSRLAMRCRQAFAEHQRSAGKDAWHSPPCEAWSHWLRACHRQARLAAAADGLVLPRLLDDHAVNALWRQTLAEDTLAAGLLDQARTVALAAEAWRLALDAGIDLPLAATEDSDAAAFNRWWQGLQQRLRSAGVVAYPELPQQLIASLQQGHLRPPSRIVLAGFDKPGAARQRLLDALTAAGSRIESLETPAHSARVHAISAPSERDELLQVAERVRALATAEPDARIGVVVHDLEQRRDALVRVFDAVLWPEGRPADDPAARPWSLSLGQPLARLPLAADALGWLDWLATGRARPLAEVAPLLLSPFWAGDEAPELLARTDWRWRQAGFERIGLRKLGRDLQRFATQAEAATAKRLAQAIGQARNLDGAGCLASEWASRFAAGLRALGWPHGGTGKLDSSDYQALQAWNEALASLGSLDGLLGRLTAREAVQALREIASERVFQPQAPRRNIEVMGALEAAGLAFDHLLLPGMDESRWPPAPRPNPFLPLALQQAAGIATASAEGQRAQAQEITRRLLTAAPEVTLSWTRRVDEQDTAISPLLRAYGDAAEAGAPGEPPRWRQLHAQTGAFETLADDRLVPPPASERVAGGIRRLQDQVECPFRSAARHGLGAEAPEQPEPGPDARERGSLLHAVMAAIWRTLRDQAALLALDAGAREALVAGCVDSALDAFQREKPQRLSEGARRVEAERLRRLVPELLACDAARAPFVVEMIEGRNAGAGNASGTETASDKPVLHLAGRDFTVVPDRIDVIDGVGHVVIDYKTGDTAQPVTAALRAPQLPAYAELTEDCIAVAYARVRLGDVAYHGVIDGDCAGHFPGLRPHDSKPPPDQKALGLERWQDIRRHWREGLEAAAAGIAAGDARVAPLPGACQWCELTGLCRVTEHDEQTGYDDPDEEEGTAA